MKITLHLARLFAGAIALMASGASYADVNCKAWNTATADSNKGKYPLELRICDLTYGLSAYVEIRNMGGQRIALAYRITTNDDKQRDPIEIVLEPGVTTRAENCQACASRHAGFKSWEILSITEAAADNNTAGAVTAAPLPAFMGGVKPAAVKASSVEAEKVVEKAPPTKPRAEAPAAEKPVTKPVEKAPAEQAIAQKPVAAPAVEQPKAETPSTTAPAVPAQEAEGFRAEDGTIIPWDKMPPEFRPRKTP